MQTLEQLRMLPAQFFRRDQCYRGAAYQHQGASDNAFVVWKFSNFCFSYHDSRSRFDVQRPVGSDTAGCGYEDAND